MKRIALLVAGGVLVAAGTFAQAETIYHWKDEHGQAHYSDKPPPATAREVEERRVFSGRPESTASFTVRRVAANFPVTLYSADSCGEACTRARALLEQRGIPFTETMVETQEDLEAFRQTFGPPDEVPAATVGPRQLRGFEAAAWHRLLDNVGYPREAPPPQ